MRMGSTGPAGRGNSLRLLLHLPNLARLYWRLFKDPRVGWLAKLVLLAGVAYVLVPIDMIIDLPFAIPGYLDDAIVMALALKAFIKLCPPNVVREHVMIIDQGG